MKIRQSYVCMGAFAAMVSAAAFTSYSLRDANAQQSTIQTDQTETEQADRTTGTDQARTNQTQVQNRTDTLSRDPNKQSWRASEIIGMDVRGRAGDDEIGEISDVMIGAEGKIVYAAVSFGGFLGLGEKLFAVPWDAVQFVREGQDEDDVYARIDVTEQQLRTKRGFNEDRWPTEADESFLPEGSRPPRQVERPVPTTQNQNVPR